MEELFSLIPSLSNRTLTPTLNHILPFLITIHLYLSKPSTFLTSLLFPLLVYYSLITPLIYTTGNAGGDFGVGSQGIFAVLNVIDKLMLSDLELDFLRNEDKVSIPLPWTLERLKWSIKLYATMRGRGWKFEVKNVPKSTPSSTTSRLKFCFQKMLSILAYYMTMDILSTGYMRTRPYFHKEVQFHQVPILERYFAAFAGGMAGYLALSMLYDLVTIVCVASTFWSIEENPPLFGSLKDCHSVRNFWSKTWHQGLRRTLSKPGQSLSNYLSLSPILNQILLISSTFALSALQHSFGLYVMDRKGLGAGIFFLLQPLGIGIEGLVWSLGKRLGIQGNGIGWRLLGYIWTFSWLLACSPWFIDELVQAGMWEINPCPFSLYNKIVNGVFQPV